AGEEDAGHGQLRLDVRWTAWTPEVTSAADLLARCLQAPVRTLARDALAGGAPVARSARAPGEGESMEAPRPPRRREVVLALGGGAARAIAHVGVLRVLRRAGISVAGVAGTSAGALVGAMSLAGMDAEPILERFTSFPSTPLYRQMRRAY